MFNRWKPYPQNKPEERGWYVCSIRYGEEKEQAYVMDLFWDDGRKLWKDNRRINVFNEYDVLAYNDETGMKDKKMYSDNLCIRNDVIAFKKLSKIYR